MASLKEAFTSPSDAQSDFMVEQQVRYQEVEPNRFVPEKRTNNLGPRVTTDTLSQFNKYDPYTESVSNRMTAAGIGQLLQGQATTTEDEDFCRSFQGVAGLQSLITEQANSKTPIRCGWRYKRSPGGGLPVVSQGALGSINGPLNAKDDPLGGGVQWIWNLKRALARTISEYTQALPPTAAGLAAAQQTFPNVAWCSQTNSFIVVDSAGNPAEGYRCARGSVVRNPSQFPADAPQTVASSMASANTQALVNCMTPGVNPSLSRDCLLQAVKTQGCSTEGTLYQAIESAKPSAANFSLFLQQQPSFQAYQSKQGANAMTEDLFRKERGTWDLATREIQKLQTASQSGSNPNVRVAAQDLCSEAGKYDVYDFCADLEESTPIDMVDMKCIQNFWQEQNGKPAGLLYPHRRPLKPELGTIQTWGAYRNAVSTLKTKTNSSDPIEQRAAINNFLGVSVSSQGFTPLNLSSLDAQFLLGGQPLVFWVDAKDGQSLTIDGTNKVRDWRDKSGGNRTLTQIPIVERPTYVRGAFPGLEFDGVRTFLPIPDAAAMVRGNMTVFVVERRKSSKLENYFLGGMTNQRNQNLVLGYYNQTTALMAFWGNDLPATVPAYANSTEPARIWCFQKESTGRQIVLNGTRVANDSRMENLQGWAGAALGRYGTTFYQGTIHEVLIYNTALSIGERQKVEGYLAHRWGLAGSLPAGHPYKLNSP
jgi:hypothetical protein